MSEKPIFLMCNEQKLRAFTTNDDFFKKVESDRETYFKSLAVLRSHFQARQFNDAVKLDLVKFLTILFIAQEQGFMEVQWDRLFAIKKDESFLQLVTSRYDYIKETLPQIPAVWDKEVSEASKQKKTKKANKKSLHSLKTCYY